MLLVLGDSDRPLTVKDLAARVTAVLADDEAVSDAVTREQITSTRVELVHAHLPKLVEHGLVGRDDDGRVATTDDPAYGNDRFERLFDGDAEDWDEVLTALEAPRRRRALVELAAARELDRRVLARRVAAREVGVGPASVPDRKVEAVLVTLHHAHVPALEDADLIASDGDAVRYEGHPDLDPTWLTTEAGAVPDA